MILNLKKKNGKNIMTKWKEYRKLPPVIKARKATIDDKIRSAITDELVNPLDCMIVCENEITYCCDISRFNLLFEEIKENE